MDDDLGDVSADGFEQLVSRVISYRDPQAPRRVIEQMLELDEDECGPLLAMTLVFAMGYLVQMKESDVKRKDLDTAVQWLADKLGPEYAGGAAIASALAGHPDGQKAMAKHLDKPSDELTVDDLTELMGPDFFPAMVWLSAGLVATCGDGDVRWLRRYEPARS